MSDPRPIVPSPDARRLVEVVNAFLQAGDEGKHKLLETEAAILLHADATQWLRQEAANQASRGTIDGSMFARLLNECADELYAIAMEKSVHHINNSAEQTFTDPDALIAELKDLTAVGSWETNSANLQRQIGLCDHLLSAIPRQLNREPWRILQYTLGLALRHLGELNGAVATLQRAIAAFREALEETSRERSPIDWARTQTNLGSALRILGDLTENVAVMLEAEEAYCAAMEVWTPEHSPMNWAETQNNLGVLYENFGRLTKDTAVLRRAEDAYRAATTKWTREQVPLNWAMLQHNLANTLTCRGEISEAADLLRKAEATYREALEERTRNRAPSRWAATQNNLANTLRILGKLTHDPDPFRAAEAACRAALLEWTKDGAPTNWALAQDNLGRVLQSLGAIFGDAASLRRAEVVYRDLLRERTRARAPTDWAKTQSHLGLVLEDLGRLTGDAAILRDAEAVFRALLEEWTRARAPANWAGTQMNLGVVLLSLGKSTADASALRKAEVAFRAALEVWTRERAPTDWAVTQMNLGIALTEIAEIDPKSDLIDSAEEAYRAALLKLTRRDAPAQWAAIQFGLGNVLHLRGERVGDASVLRQAELAHRAALEVWTKASASRDWSLAQHSLGMTLSSLGGLTGDVAMLREAETAFRLALEERTLERAPSDWVMTQTCIGNVLCRIGELTKNEVVLREAVAAFRSALSEPGLTFASTPLDQAQFGLSSALLCLGSGLGNVTMLREAVAGFRGVLQMWTRKRTPKDWALVQHNLGTSLSRLGELSGDITLLREAESAYRASLEVRTRELAPIDWALTQNNLGKLLDRLGYLTNDATDSLNAEIAYREALDVLDECSADDVRQLVAEGLSLLLTRRKCYSDAVKVIELTLKHSNAILLDTRRSRGTVTQAIARVGGLHSLLSVCLLRQQESSDRSAALIALESGRARILADAIALDTVRLMDINDLSIKTAIQKAGQRCDDIRIRLGYLLSGGTNSSRERVPQNLTTETRTRLQIELRVAMDSYMSLCRQHGLIEVQDSLGLDDIHAAVPSGGALVVPVVTGIDAFAFVVTEAPGQPGVVELPELRGHTIQEHLSGAGAWLGVYFDRFRDHSEDADGGAAVRKAAAGWCTQLSVTRAWLWDCLLGPIHAHLRDTAHLKPDAPIVLLPPGLLSQLPLHAAGPAPDGLDFGDHWTISYAPSIRALLTSEERAIQRRDAPVKLLAIIDPPSEKRLYGAQQEAPMLRRRFADAEQVVLEDTAATLPAVMQHLPTATHIHASTHGWHDPFDPLKSGLHLADEPLLLEALHHTHLTAARLVFLSACESALVDIRRMPEEHVGLPAGMIHGGAACVVATLWPIRDDVAFLMADAFYGALLDENGRERTTPMRALRDAVRWLRNVTFSALKRRFEVVETPDGQFIELSGEVRFQNPPAGAPPPPPPPRDLRLIRLPLGPDEDRPYEAPEHWTVFTVTGA